MPGGVAGAQLNGCPPMPILIAPSTGDLPGGELTAPEFACMPSGAHLLLYMAIGGEELVYLSPAGPAL